MSEKEEKKFSIETFLELEANESKNLPTISDEFNKEELIVNHAQDDYEFARRNLRDLIANGTSLLQDASDLATSGQQPEHYQAATNTLKTLIDANKVLLDLSKTHQKITGAESKGTKVVNQNLFVGSTADLLKLRGNRNGNTAPSDQEK